MPDPQPRPVRIHATPVLAAAAVRKPPATVLRADNVRLITTYTAGILKAQTENAPAFPTAPSRAGEVLRDTGGKTYFMPEVSVARRGKEGRWPDVFIDVEAGTYTLRATFDVKRPGGAPPDAAMVPMTGFQVALYAANLPRPLALTVDAVPAPEDEGIEYRLSAHAEADLNQLLGALQEDPRATFRVSAEASYRIQTGGGTPQGGQPQGGQPIMVRMNPAVTAALMRNLGRAGGTGPAGGGRRVATPVRPAVRGPGAPRPRGRPTGGGGTTSAPKRARIELGRPSAYYHTANPANTPVYAQVNSQFSVHPDVGWVRSPDHGYFRESPIPHQFYILPDGFGLAFDEERQLPSVTTLLIAGDDPDSTGVHGYRIRVALRVMPRFDAARLARLRRYLSDHTGVPYPELVVGGFEEARFLFTRLLSDLGSEVVGPEETEGEVVDAASGFEIVLDTTSQAYGLLQAMLRSTDSEGRVRFKLKMDDGSDVLHEVPLDMNLARPATHPLTVEIETDEEDHSPDAIVIRNPSGIPAAVAGVEGALLFVDSNVPYPIDAIPARAEPATLELPPGESVRVVMTPTEEVEGALWGGIAVELSGVRLELDPDAVLSRIHELTPATDLKSTVRLWSFLLGNPDRMPPELADLYGIEVEVRRPDGEPLKGTLTLGGAERMLDVSYTFADLLAGRSPGQPTFEYRQRNLLNTGAGDWSPWETVTGRDLHVAPAMP